MRFPLFVAVSPRWAELILLRIGGLLKLALADDGVRNRRDLPAALDFDLLFVALVDLGDADHMLVLADSEDGDALRVSSHHPYVADGGADHLALVSDEHQRFALVSGEARNHAAVALGRVNVGDALSTAISAAVFIGRGAFAV